MLTHGATKNNEAQNLPLQQQPQQQLLP